MQISVMQAAEDAQTIHIRLSNSWDKQDLNAATNSLLMLTKGRAAPAFLILDLRSQDSPPPGLLGFIREIDRLAIGGELTHNLTIIVSHHTYARAFIGLLQGVLPALASRHQLARTLDDAQAVIAAATSNAGPAEVAKRR